VTDSHRFDVVLADPPWQYANVRTGGSLSSGAAAHYPTMSVDELCALPVPVLMRASSVCFLWATVPLLPEAFTVLEAWRYRYKTCLVWDKADEDLFGAVESRLGLGFWVRVQTELLLVGVRGTVTPFGLAGRNIIRAPATGHSAKPAQARRLIDQAVARAFTDPQKVELFAREQHAGWTAIGNAIDGRSIGDVLAGRTAAEGNAWATSPRGQPRARRGRASTAANRSR
jgi:N6-adenosine-specific RNA methylase IME4